MQLNTIAGRTYNDLNQYPVVSVWGGGDSGVEWMSSVPFGVLAVLSIV